MDHPHRHVLQEQQETSEQGLSVPTQETSELLTWVSATNSPTTEVDRFLYNHSATLTKHVDSSSSSYSVLNLPVIGSSALDQILASAAAAPPSPPTSLSSGSTDMESRMSPDSTMEQFASSSSSSSSSSLISSSSSPSSANHQSFYGSNVAQRSPSALHQVGLPDPNPIPPSFRHPRTSLSEPVPADSTTACASSSCEEDVRSNHDNSSCNYDSDAFNSDDSCSSFAEVEAVHQFAQRLQQQQQQSQAVPSQQNFSPLDQYQN